MAMINIVVRHDGWVLERLARKLALHIGAHVSEKADPNAEANIYFPYYLYEGETNWDVALFTHREFEAKAPEKAAKFDDVAMKCNVAIAMSNKTAEFLPPHKTRIVEFPADEKYNKEKLTLGICGHEQPYGRKRLQWASAVAEIPGVEVLWANGYVADEDMPTFYRQIDYLLVTAENEGGPMPVKEALAAGTPIIAPNVGWCWDYPVIRYETLDELKDIVRKLTPDPHAWKRTGHAYLAACDPKEFTDVRHDSLQNPAVR